MLRNHRNLRNDRASFLAYVSQHSDAAHNVRVVDETSGAELLIFRSKSGHVLGEAAYPAGGMRPVYRVKVAHSLVLGFAASLALLASAQTVHATADGARLDTQGMRRELKVLSDPFPVAAVAEEVENHSYSIARRGHPAGCVANVSARDDGTFFVTLVTVDGKPLTFPHGPYPSETVGMIDVLGAFGRDC